MRAKETLILDENEETANLEAVDDIFAADFFSVAPQSAEEPESPAEILLPEDLSAVAPPIEEITEKSPWFAALPQISRRDAELSNALTQFPPDLPLEILIIISETLARYLARPTNDLNFEINAVRETNWETLQTTADESRLFQTISLGATDVSAVVAVNSAFWLALIDALLGGGENLSGQTLRSLSRTELVIAEFLSLAVLSEINQTRSENPLRLISVAAVPPNNFAAETRGAEINISLHFGTTVGAARIFLPDEFGRSFGEKKQSRAMADSFGQIKRVAAVLNVRLALGTTKIDAANLAFLETGDVVLLENPQIPWHGDKTAHLKIGSGNNVKLRGKLDAAQSETDKNGKFTFISEELSSEKMNFEPARIIMEETPIDETEAVNLAALENVMLNLRVEMAARKISLDELRGLRVGQIIELGCKPTDAVELVTDTDGKPVAVGELVEIEGTLGVKLTKVFV